MNVATALNRKYLLYTGVMLTSLCENNPCHIDIYILHSELTDTDIQRLTECVDKYDISIHPLYIEKDKFEGKMYTDKMWSIEAYYRLMLLDILPSNVKRMFYFDVDIIVNKSPENIEVSFSDILNILVQADRRVLNDIKEKWTVIARYRFNLNTAKFASMLCDGKPVAAAPGGIIVAFEHQPNVNEVNETQNYYQLKNFLKEVLGENYDFIAIKNSLWPDMRSKYIDMNRAGTLPAPEPIVLHHIGEFKEKRAELNDAQAMAVELFGDLVEFEE